VDATVKDNASVVGEECHIVSARANGPRYNRVLDPSILDEYENLILLCRVHHKMVDDQPETYTVEILSRTKAVHEKWVVEKLSERQEKQVRVKRVEQNIPKYLSRLTGAKEVMEIVNGAFDRKFDHDELLDQNEVELVGSFLELAEDWPDVSRELGSIENTRIRFQMDETIKALDDVGFWVFGARELLSLEGNDRLSIDWPRAHLKVVRKMDNNIIHPHSPTEDSSA
jgi:hypothetical protein